MNKNEILELVIKHVKSLDDVNMNLDGIEINGDTVLFGTNSMIDSLSLVSVVVDLEMYLSDILNKDISLTDDRAMTREISPYDSISNLTDYIFELINE